MLKCTLAYVLTFPEQNISKAETRNWHESSAFAHRLQYIQKKGYYFTVTGWSTKLKVARSECTLPWREKGEVRQPRNSPTRYLTRRYQRKIVQLNPFAPEPPVRIHVPSTACDVIRRWTRATLSANACRVKRSFKPYQNEHNSVKDTGEKGKKTM